MTSYTITQKDLALLENILQKYRLQDYDFAQEYEERVAFTTRVALAVNVAKTCETCGK
jgi:hypothetical protein